MSLVIATFPTARKMPIYDASDRGDGRLHRSYRYKSNKHNLSQDARGNLRVVGKYLLTGDHLNCERRSAQMRLGLSNAASLDHLIETMDGEIVRPAEAKFRQLLLRRAERIEDGRV
jgi:hypothetical protein